MCPPPNAEALTKRGKDCIGDERMAPIRSSDTPIRCRRGEYHCDGLSTNTKPLHKSEDISPQIWPIRTTKNFQAASTQSEQPGHSSFIGRSSWQEGGVSRWANLLECTASWDGRRRTWKRVIYVRGYLAFGANACQKNKKKPLYVDTGGLAKIAVFGPFERPWQVLNRKGLPSEGGRETIYEE